MVLTTQAVAAQLFIVNMSVYNQTDEVMKLSGHSDEFYGDINITPSHNSEISTDVTKPLVMKFTPQEIGKMYRFTYDIDGKAKACTIDFVIRWHAKLKKYRLDNLHARGHDGVICPIAPIKYNSAGNKVDFSLAVVSL
jgi:hypothetical protein